MKQMRKTEDLVFGIRTVIEAVKEGKTINKVLVQKGLTGDLLKELMRLLNQEQVVVQKVPVQKLNHMVKKNHQGVIAMISPIPYSQLDWVIQSIYEKGEDPFILVLDRVKDVRNFGAIARTAECMGVHAIVVPNRDTALITGDAIKTSAGALYKVPVCKVNHLLTALDFVKGCGLKVYGCTEKTSNSVNKVSSNGPIALVMGSEENGVDPKILKNCDELFGIPMKGTIASLNVSVATAIAIYALQNN